MTVPPGPPGPYPAQPWPGPYTAPPGPGSPQGLPQPWPGSVPPWPGPAPRPPLSLRGAAWLWLGCAAVYLGAVLVQVVPPLIRSMTTWQGTPANWTALDRFGALEASAVVSAAVWVLYVFHVRTGHNWARVGLASVSVPVLAWDVLIVSRLFGLGGGPRVFAAVLVLIKIVLYLAANVAMFLPTANSYFAARRHLGQPPG